MSLKKIINLFVPPLFLQGYRSLRGVMSEGHYGLSGDYRSWEEAAQSSTGYDSKVIIEKTKAAILKVKKGEAVGERDSVLFDEVQCSWPLLAGLLWVAAQSGGKLNVLDFGGSLGSTYFQNRVFLNRLIKVRWNIVEQMNYVKIGKECFEDDDLKFYSSIDECLSKTTPNVIILGSVLQYLERPYDVLSELQGLPCEHIIIDRTPFWNGSQDRLCVQSVSPSIYPASYPCWIFSTQSFTARFNRDWEFIAEFESQDRLEAPIKIIWKGMHIMRKSKV